VLQPLAPTTSPRLKVIWADHTYQNHALNAWIDTAAPGQWRLAMVRRPAGSPGFVR
jgi:hypothetical protein